MKSKILSIITLLVFGISSETAAQYRPNHFSSQDDANAALWVEKTYNQLSMDEKLGQLFIVALYTNKGDDHIEQVRQLVKKEQLGGLILMQDNPERHIQLVNEFQSYSKTPMLIGMDAEWGLFQRIAVAKKFPWAMTLGAIQDKNLIHTMAAKIADDAKRMGVNWDFAPVVDVNTNPKNPIIGNRSFGSEVGNVTASALAYSEGLQHNNVLAAIKHFPGHGDTDVDSHLDLPVVSHDIQRLNSIELAPFKALMNKGIGGVMVAHLYVPALEPQQGIPASISKNIITDLLKGQLGYKGLIITDALNMGAVAKRYQPGELDALAFKAGNDIMLFSEGVKEGKRHILQAIEQGEIPKERVEESVKKILLTKYYLGLKEYFPRSTENINKDLNNESHTQIVQTMYANALTLLKHKKKLLPLKTSETYYYIPLEEAPYHTFLEELQKQHHIILKSEEEIASIPKNAKVIVGFHKDNSTAYKPYKISEKSKTILAQLKNNHQVILSVFGSPYALQDIDLKKIPTVLVAYENNDDAMTTTAKALQRQSKIHGRLPVEVNRKIKNGMGITLNPKNAKP